MAGFTAIRPRPFWYVSLFHEVTVWADGYSEDGEDLVFGLLVRATSEEQERLEVTSRTPSDAERVVVTVARLPQSSVLRVTSTMSD